MAKNSIWHKIAVRELQRQITPYVALGNYSAVNGLCERWERFFSLRYPYEPRRAVYAVYMEGVFPVVAKFDPDLTDKINATVKRLYSEFLD